MSSYPKRKDKFTAWSKAMVEGATVDKPSYPGTKRAPANRRHRKKRKQRKRKNHGSKD